MSSSLFRNFTDEILEVSHGGHCGDIIYSLPLANRLSEITRKKLRFFVKNDQPSFYSESMRHPSGGIRVNQAMFDFIEPLLGKQPFIHEVIFCNSSAVPKRSIALDFYRNKETFFNIRSGNIVDWGKKYFGINYNSHTPWLEKSPNKTNQIIFGFTKRYRNLSISYEILNEIDNIGFVGTEDEFAHFKSTNRLSNLQHIVTKDAIALLEVISQSRLFFGNQSLSFSLAEACKCSRALEVCELIPNVIPSGDFGYSYMNAISFRNVISRVLSLNEKNQKFLSRETARYSFSIS